MPTLTVIVGYCGSGKSWLLERMRAEHPDAFTLDEGAMVFPNGQPPYVHAEVAAALVRGTDAFVTLMECAHLAHRVLLDALVQAQAPGTAIAWRFFEDNLAQANRNVCRDAARERDVKGNIEQNIRWSGEYDIPNGAEVMPINVLPGQRRERRFVVTLEADPPNAGGVTVASSVEGDRDVAYLARTGGAFADLEAMRAHLADLTGDEIALVEAPAR